VAIAALEEALREDGLLDDVVDHRVAADPVAVAAGA
jgi:hypothetical protein